MSVEVVAPIEGDVAPPPVHRANSLVMTVVSTVFLLLLALFFLFPFYAIARFSLQRVPVVLLGANNLFDRWTLEGIREAFTHPQFATAVRFSLTFAIATVVLALALMLPTAMWVQLKVPQARSLVETLTVLPYMVPPIALVVGVAGAYKDAVPWFFNSRFVLVPFYAVLAMPFTYRALDAGLRAIDLRTLVDASRSLGAGWGTTFFRVLVPNMRVAILTSSFLTATVVLGEFTMASILGFSFPNRITLPVFTQVLGQQSPFAGYAIGLLTLFVSILLLAAITFITGGRAARRPRPEASEAAHVSEALQFRSIRKTFGANTALESFDLTLEPGEFVSLLGPSGCGKTTALRIAAGFERPDSGAVMVGAKDVLGVPAHKRNMGMVFQSYSLFPNLTVSGNVAFGLRVRKISGGERTRRVAEALERVHLSSFSDRYPHQLSGGQQQRVALARALVFEPAVLLLDEPLSALDAKVRVGLREEIRRLQLQLGMTTLFVTHDQEEALSISDRVGVMSNGRLEQLGSPREVYGEPATSFVARFVGRINELPGTVSAGGIEVGGARVGLDAPSGFSVGDAVVVMSRPEDLSVRSLNGDASGLVGSVVSEHFSGSSSLLRIRLDRVDLLVDVQRGQDEEPFVPGDRVQVALIPARAHVVAP